MMKSNGYINATKMCTSGGKDFCDWTRLKGSHQLIEAVQNKLVLENTLVNSNDSNFALRDSDPQICGTVCKCITTENSTEADKLISGTYCHPLLIPHIACWVSADFALKVSEVVNGYMVAQYKAQLTAANEATFRAQQQTRLSMSQTELTLRLIDHVKQQTRMKQETIEQKEHQHQMWASTHAFTMLRLNSPDAKRPYYALRRKRNDMSGAIMKLRAKHPAAVMVYQNSYVPNPINLYNRLKSCGILQFDRNFCSSLVGAADMIAKLEDLCIIIKH